MQLVRGLISPINSRTQSQPTEYKLTAVLCENKSMTSFMVTTFLEVENKYDNIISYCLSVNLNLLTLGLGKRVDTWIRRFVVCITEKGSTAVPFRGVFYHAIQSGSNV